MIAGCRLRRALERKVYKLREVLCADGDVSSELERVSCRLMKLALRCGAGRRAPPPPRWMSCRLLDLLTLTEKAIERRRRHFVENYPLRAIRDGQEEDTQDMVILTKIKEDDTAVKLVDKYQHLIQRDNVDRTFRKRCYYDMTFEDAISASSKEFLKDCEFIENKDTESTPTLIEADKQTHIPKVLEIKEKIERTQAWVNYDTMEMLPHSVRDVNSEIINSFNGDKEKTSKGARFQYKKSYKRHRNVSNNVDDLDLCGICKKMQSRRYEDKYKTKHDNKSEKLSKTKLMKKELQKKSSYTNFIKYSASANYRLKSKKNIRKHYHSQSTASKPIPADVIQLCDSVKTKENNVKQLHNLECKENKTDNAILVDNEISCQNIAATKESVLIDIIMDDMEETIALRRNIGTDAEDSRICVLDTDLESIVNIIKEDSYHNPIDFTENVQSQTIFLYDIDQPSTSKGVRHIGMDVQCGPDTTFEYTQLSRTNSLATVSRIFTAGIKLGDSVTNVNNCSNFATKTNYDVNYKAVTPKKTYPGIIINDVDPENRIIEANGYQNGGVKTSTVYDDKLLKIDSSVTKITNFNVRTPTYLNTDVLAPACSYTQHITPKCTSIAVASQNLEPSNYSVSGALGKEAFDSSIATNSNKETYNMLFPCRCNSQDAKARLSKARNSETNIKPNKEQCFFTSTNDDKQIFQKFYANTGTPVKIVIDSKTNLPLINAVENRNYKDSVAITTFDLESFVTNIPRRSFPELNIVISSDITEEKAQCFTVTNEIVPASNILTPSIALSTETKMIKPVSSCIKVSSSEFNELVNSSKNTSELRIEASFNKIRGLDNVKYVRPKLSCGGVHIHSYKDRQVSEDVVFQGEWQRHKSKILSTKKAFSSIGYKKGPLFQKKKNISKEKITSSKQENKGFKSKIEQKKPLQIRNPKLYKTKQTASKTDVDKKTPALSNCVKTAQLRHNKGLVKNMKVAPFIKNPALPTVKDTDKSKKGSNRNDIPIHIKINSRKKVIDRNKLNQSIDSLKMTIKLKEESIKNVFSLTRSKTEEIKKDILRFRKPNQNIKYVVMRNEIENKNSGTSEINNKNDTTTKSTNKRQHSPVSQHSSTGSSPNSIATVKARPSRSKTVYSKKYSSSSKNCLENPKSEDSMPTRNKKYTKKCHSTKKTDKVENKENVSESVKIQCCSISNRESIKTVSSTFTGKTKNVFMAQFTSDNTILQTNSSSKVPNKSNVKLSTTASSDEKRTVSPSVSKKISKKSICEKDTVESQVIENTFNSKTTTFSFNAVNANSKNECTDNKLTTLLSTNQLQKISPIKSAITYNLSSMSDEEPVFDSRTTELIDGSNSNNDSHTSSISTAMRKLIENILEFGESLSTKHKIIDSKTAIFDRDSKERAVLDSSSSPSHKVVIAQGGTFEKPLNNVEFALNRIVDTTLGNESVVSLAGTSLTVADLDLLSFKSITTVSKVSEYFSADNGESFPNSASVHDIFERKNQSKLPSPAGALAVQAFSGYSMNVEPVVGDQPDYVNVIDSETGSLALGFTRQATSEELFVSGRSSESYESCLIEDDAVVPNWLFHVISQQQSVEEAVPQPMAAPAALPGPVYDVNGNMAGAAAGAGDGRGVHSDRSRDSSGRGTSLSSTDTSSGPQSEAILIDPSAFSGQFELLREQSSNELTMPAIVIPLASPDSSFRTADGSDTDTLSSSQENHTARNTLNALLVVTSDIEADVSSIDTDIVDSSDN